MPRANAKNGGENTQPRPDPANTTPQLLNRLRMRQVALLLAIADRRTLRGAAAELGMTQPAATKMLHELEDALGQPLFERGGRGLLPNPAGERVTGFFRSVRGSVEALNRELTELRLGSAGRFKVGSIEAASATCLTDALLGLKAAFPLLAIEVVVDTSDRLLERLNEGALEVVIGRHAGTGGSGGRRDADWQFTPIDDEGLAIVVGNAHPLAAKRKVRFEDLLVYPWVLHLPGSRMRDCVEREFSAHHAALPKGLIETSSIATTINLIRRSELVAVIPEAVARRDAANGVLHILRYAIGQQLEDYGSIVRRDRPLSRPAERFLALLHAPRAGKTI